MFSRSQDRTARPRGGMGGLSFIGPEMTIGGDVSTTGPLHVDGRIDGNVRCETLIEGPTGTIAGDIVAEAPAPAVPAQGAMCFQASDDLTIAVSVGSGKGAWAAQLWGD